MSVLNKKGDMRTANSTNETYTHWAISITLKANSDQEQITIYYHCDS